MTADQHARARDALRKAVHAGDVARLEAAFADEVLFQSPVVHKPYTDRAAITQLLGIVFETFEDFRYVDELDGETAAGLIFRARIGDKELQGLDLLRGDEAGRITELTVMVRPLSGAIALAQAVGARLEAASA